MVSDVDSVTTQGDYGVTITLKAPNSAFLDYLACPYGPRMLSPDGARRPERRHATTRRPT